MAMPREMPPRGRSGQFLPKAAPPNNRDRYVAVKLAAGYWVALLGLILVVCSNIPVLSSIALVVLIGLSLVIAFGGVSKGGSEFPGPDRPPGHDY
jgi:hypothetical protein